MYPVAPARSTSGFAIGYCFKRGKVLQEECRWVKFRYKDLKTRQEGIEPFNKSTLETSSGMCGSGTLLLYV